jgi:GR25 family glycosyltransferase involved in LPS biosynthesis
MINTYFEKIYCINLDSRVDRFEQSKLEFDKHNLNVERISGFDGSKMNLDFPPEIEEGAVGCALSQLYTLKLAKQIGLDNFLLLEDDIQFDEQLNQKFHHIIPEIPDDWDMLYLGGQHFHGMGLKQVSKSIFKCEYTLAAHSVAFKYTVFDTFIDALIDITKPCDVHYAQSHKEINAYVIIPHLTWQREGYSDIKKTNVDYTFLKQHRYPQWGKP